MGKENVVFSFYEPVTIDELWIKNGYWKISNGNDQYTRNSRPKKITITYLYAGSSDFIDAKSYTLKDDKKRKDWQKIQLGLHKDISQIRIRIDSIYKGTKYKNDVCISEVKWILTEP